MKKILVPTDFSDHAKNAGFYAVELAKTIQSKIYLLHTYNLSASALYPPQYSGSTPSDKQHHEHVQKIEKENELHLNTFKETILKGNTTPKCTLAQTTGFVSESVNQYAERKNIDLIVMGTKGKTKRPDGALAPITFDVINSGIIPVMAINEHTKFAQIKKIAIAIDKIVDTEILRCIEVVTKLAGFFDAKVFIFWCNTKEKVDKKSIFTNSVLKEAEEVFKDIKWDIKIIEDKNEEKMAQSVDDCISENNINLLSLITRKQSIFHKIYQSSQIKNKNFHTEIPLLAIPGV
ncbi:MAG: universal stress protein [Bacteroidota bacterium]